MTKYAWRHVVRVIVVAQLGLIVLLVGVSRYWTWVFSQSPDGPYAWIEWTFTGIYIFALYTFPFWTFIPAWKSDFPSWKIWLLLLVELALWFTLFVALLPGFQ